MKWNLAAVLSVACIAFAALFFLASVTGLLFAEPTPVTDVGLLSTVGIALLFGVFGMLLSRRLAAGA